MRTSTARMVECILCGCALATMCAAAGPAAGQEIDWGQVGDQSAYLLSQYIRIDTENPPGRTVEAADFLAEQLRSSGLEVERIAGATAEKPFVIGRLRGSAGLAKPIVLLNHMDVVPAHADEWTFDPYSGHISGGIVHGRGAIDMKGFGIIQLMALRLLAQRGEKPRHDVVFLAVPDEEVGGTQGTAWLAQNRPDLFDVEAVWDEGGSGISDAFPVPVLFISVTEKKVLWLRLVAEGPAGHGSRPLADAAPRRLQQALERIFNNLPPPRLTPISRQVFREIGTIVGGVEGFALRRLKNPLVWLFADGLLQQDPLTNAMVRDTIALTMLRAGYKPNVIPARAEAVLDCRLLPQTNQKAFIAALQRTIDDPHIHIEILQPTEPAPASPTDQPMYRAMTEAAHLVYPSAVITPSMSLGGTDSRFFRKRSVPSYGLIPALLPRELLLTTHGTDERIPVSVLGPSVRVVYETLKKM
jgi:acetylornithine deacetylase/succinyl-diaminopimelate desuccinylase-like protein